MAGPYDSLVGPSGMLPGQLGWIVLDVNGVPQTLQPTQPAVGLLYCSAMVCNPIGSFDALVTGTGAPLRAGLQPDNDTFR